MIITITNEFVQPRIDRQKLDYFELWIADLEKHRAWSIEHRVKEDYSFSLFLLIVLQRTTDH